MRRNRSNNEKGAPMGAATATAAAPGGNAAAEALRKRAAQGKAKAKARRIARQPDDDGILWGSDLGSLDAIKSGRAEYVTNADVPDDPNDPHSAVRTKPRAQMVWAPDRLMKGRSPALDQAQYDAAVRYLNDWLIGEQGARAGADMSGIRLDPWARLPYSERRAMARQSWRNATQAAGARFSAVLVWCVLQQTPGPTVPPTVEAWAVSVGWRTDKATVWLTGALELLKVHYGFDRPSSGPATIAPGRREGDGS